MEDLFQFCSTPRQREILRKYLDSGRSSEVAGELLGTTGRNVRRSIASVKKRAAAHGWTESFDARRFVDPGQNVVGKSTLTKDDEGNIVWIKTARERKTYQFAQELSEYVNDISPWEGRRQPKKTSGDLCTLYTITDYHIGMYSSVEESGEEWSLGTAQEVLERAVTEMIESSPPSEQAVFCQLGDLLHWDSLEAITPRGKNVLDADGRYHTLTKVAVDCCINVVNLLLGKHKKVHVIMAEGNHDLASSVWLRLMMNQVFEKNKRVSIETSAFPYYRFNFGKCFLGFHHGHLSRIKDMPAKFYSEFPGEMGAAKFRKLHTGHTHQVEMIESSGVTVERHPTLAARDAHGARGFHKTVRAANAITYHKELGEVSRHVVYPK